MLRYHTATSAYGVKKYFEQSDYYADEAVGRWGGKLAERLGLSGTVDKASFDRLCDNRRPDGSPLTQRTNDNRRVGNDHVYSGPKSFGVVAMLAPEEQRRDLLQLLVDTAERVQTIMQEDMRARVRKNGEDGDRLTGNMAWASFLHTTSRPVDGRPPDPHPHVHAFTFNATYDPEEREVKAGEFCDIVRDRSYYEALFFSMLADGMVERGFAIDRRPDGKWELAGVPQSVIEKFSKRTGEIEEEARRLNITDPGRKAELGQKTRSKKQKELSPAELRRAWDAQLTDGERDALAAVYRRDVPQGRQVTAAEAIEYAIAHCSEQLSVIPERELKRVALLHGLGSITPEAIDREMKEPRHGLIVEAIDGRRMATTEQLQAEEDQIIGFAARGKGAVAAVGLPSELERGRLNDGQWAAVTGLLESENRYNVVTGPAGAGKTDMLKTYAAGMAMAGKGMGFLATTSDAVEVLHRDGFGDARTVAHFLLDERLQNSLRNGYVVVDEASMLGHKDALKFFRLADRLGLKVTLVGDPMQHGSVPRGALLKILKEYAGLREFRLKEIVRQRGNPGYLAAVASLAEGRTLEGFDALNSLGYVREIAGDDERFKALAADYVQAVRDNASCLVVSPTHAEAGRITEEIRSQLRAAGLLDREEHEFTRLVAVNASEAERGQASTYGHGPLVVQFHQNAKGGHKKGDRLIAEDASAVPLAEAGKFSLYRQESIGLAVGDKLRFTGTVKTIDGKHSLKNGAVRIVTDIQGDRLRLDNGWVISGRDAGHIRHGFVDTSFGSQGKTVRRVLLGMSAASAGAMNQEQMYVSASRGKESVTVYTDSTAAVRSAIRRSSRKLAAVDLRREKPQAKANPFHQQWERARRHLERRRRAAYLDGLMPSRDRRPLHADQQLPVSRPATHVEQLRQREQRHER